MCVYLNSSKSQIIGILTIGNSLRKHLSMNRVSLHIERWLNKVKAERLDPLLFCLFVTINIMSLKSKLTVASLHFQLISLYINSCEHQC